MSVIGETLQGYSSPIPHQRICHIPTSPVIEPNEDE
jgi:hypothetical protein